MGVAPEGQSAMPSAAQPLDPETLFLPTGDALTERFKSEQPRMYERYLRIRSTATRLEAMGHPRRPGQRTADERTGMADRAGAITSPMLVVVGGLDRLVPWCERLHELVPQSEYEVIAGAPHNVYYEAAEAYNARLDTFLAKIAAGSGAQSGVR
jgi:pimeloyl-ACP methyl ester carboxylesterase